jgi:PTH2 family peptidyl-tRNA hydrolase
LKQAIVARQDVRMGKGKLAAQVAHASLSAAEEAMKKHETWYSEWKDEGQKKVVLKIGSETELRGLFKTARSARLPAALVEDRGLTQLEPGTVTCLGIGPGPDAEIDAITGKLKLL